MSKKIKSYEVKLFTIRKLWRFRIRKEWVWSVIASNGQIIGRSTESYVNKSDAEYNIKSLGLSLSNFEEDE